MDADYELKISLDAAAKNEKTQNSHLSEQPRQINYDTPVATCKQIAY